jgi:hypothetical protein
VVAGQKLNLTLATSASGNLPAPVAAALAGVTSFGLDAAVTQKPGVTSASLSEPLTGTAQAPATIKALPALTATGTAAFVLTGTGVIVAPAPTLTITPDIGTKALAVIPCTPASAGSVDVKVTVTPMTVGTSGPLYTCRFSVGGASDLEYWHLPATMSASGGKTTGATDAVTYTNPLLGALGGNGVNQVTADFSGSLPVTGAQRGKIALNRPLDLTVRQPKATGKFKLTTAGTDHVLIPRQFALALHVTGEPVEDVNCKLNAAHGAAALTISVTKAHGNPHPSQSPTAKPTPSASPGGGQPQGNGFPSGAPGTGGGVGSAGSIATVLAGACVAAAGGGLVLIARRRRAARR